MTADVADLSLPRSAFGGLLVRWNGLDAAGFAGWDFQPGMRFGEREAWWRPGARREAPHEGLDIGWYRTASGARRALGAGARVPVLWPGTVVAIVPDFLGTSVFVVHGGPDRAGWSLHTACGHLEPRPRLTVGARLDENDSIGTIAGPAGRNTAVPPHLHLTLARIDRTEGSEPLDWDAMRDTRRVTLLDPLPLLGIPLRRK